MDHDMPFLVSRSNRASEKKMLGITDPLTRKVISS
jgi:hypothetical protein